MQTWFALYMSVVTSFSLELDLPLLGRDQRHGRLQDVFAARQPPLPMLVRESWRFMLG